jgi:hypothetical protein
MPTCARIGLLAKMQPSIRRNIHPAALRQCWRRDQLFPLAGGLAGRICCARGSVSVSRWAPQMWDLHLKFFQFEHTTNCADVKTEEHTETISQLNQSITIDTPNKLDASKHIPAKTGRRGHGKGPPSVDLMRILLDSIVLDNEPNELCPRADRFSHGELFERRQTSGDEQSGPEKIHNQKNKQSTLSRTPTKQEARNSQNTLRPPYLCNPIPSTSTHAPIAPRSALAQSAPRIATPAAISPDRTPIRAPSTHYATPDLPTRHTQTVVDPCMYAPDAQTSVPSTEAVGAWLGWGVLVGGTGSARLGN